MLCQIHDRKCDRTKNIQYCALKCSCCFPFVTLELPSKPGGDVENTRKTNTAPSDCLEKSSPHPLEDKPSTELLNDTTMEVKDEEEHLCPEVGKAAQSMVTGHQFSSNNLVAVQANVVYRDGQNISEKSSLLCAGFSPPLPDASSLATASQFQQVTLSDAHGIDEQKKNGVLLKIETDPSLNSDGGGTRLGTVSPVAANSQSLLEENQRIQPCDQMVNQENAVDHDGQNLLDIRMSFNPQLLPDFNVSILPVLAMQNSVNQLQQATPSEQYGTDEAENSNSSSQSGTEDSLSSGISSVLSRRVTPEAANSPQLGQLHPKNVIAGEAIAMNHDGPVLLGNRGIPLEPQFSPASNASRLSAVPSRSAEQDPVGQYHQATPWDTFGTDVAEDSFSSSQRDTDGSLSSDDSRTQSIPFTPQAENSPQLHRLHPNNPMTGEANTGVNHDGPAWGMPLDSQKSSAACATSAMQDPVGQIHWGMARDIYSSDKEENSSSLSQCDTDACVTKMQVCVHNLQTIGNCPITQISDFNCTITLSK